jgi:hypothetical protein
MKSLENGSVADTSGLQVPTSRVKLRRDNSRIVGNPSFTRLGKSCPSSGRDRSRGDRPRLQSQVGRDFGVVGSRRFESNLCAESRHMSVYLARPGGITSATPSATIRLLVASW